jgi:hypothetical protein
LILDVIMRFAGNKNAAGYCKGLHPGSNIHSITIHIVAIHHYITRVYTDAQGYGWKNLHFKLYSKRCFYTFNRTGKSTQSTVTS